MSNLKRNKILAHTQKLDKLLAEAYSLSEGIRDYFTDQPQEVALKASINLIRGQLYATCNLTRELHRSTYDNFK